MSPVPGGDTQLRVEPAAAGLLVLGDEHGAVRRAGGGGGEQVGVGRPGALDDVELRPRPDERGPQRGGVQRLDGPVHACGRYRRVAPRR